MKYREKPKTKLIDAWKWNGQEAKEFERITGCKNFSIVDKKLLCLNISRCYSIDVGDYVVKTTEGSTQYQFCKKQSFEEYYESIYDSIMDEECIKLCDAINSIPGIKTYSSCCGHGESSFDVWFHITDHSKLKNLIIIARVFNRSYSGLSHEWTCTLDCNDTPELSPCFLISSNETFGAIAYNEANLIAENIYTHLDHKNFKKIYGIKI